jgi:RimJ/RimL family protein N-acetyltransferase
LRLRRWRDEDLAPFAALNADARVMEHFPSLHTEAESQAQMQRIREHFDQHGFGLWAVEVPGVTAFAGFTGIMIPSFEAPFTPCVELGWRLAFEHWGHGYATEAARASVHCAFDILGFSELVAFTSPGNARSRDVMERLGMHRDPRDDFDHPRVPAGHPLRRHVLYRLPKNGPRRGAVR